jgi:hypothetical protein
MGSVVKCEVGFSFPSQNQSICIGFHCISSRPIIMKVTFSIVFLLSAATAVRAAGALRQKQQQPERNLQDNPRFANTFVDTKADTTVRPNDIVSTFTHADITDIEGGGGSGAYGTVHVKYFNVVDQTCYDAPGDKGALCRCSTSDEVVTSPATGGTPITPVFTTVASVTGAEDIVKTVVRDDLAPLLDSDANTVVADRAYVAYCLRLSLVTDDAIPLVANSQDVLIYFTGTNDPRAGDFDVNDEKADDNDSNNTGSQSPESGNSEDENDEEGSCQCFFASIFCWIFQCLLAALFS